MISLVLMSKNDRNFDDLVRKFDKNIYGTSKGKLRHELLLHQLCEHVLPDAPIDILDAGGGTGEMTRALLQLGHRVTLNDISSESLLAAQEKCQAFSDVQYLCSSIQDIPKQISYDLVTCHAVLEWAADQTQLLDDLVSLTRPGGYISLSFYNYHAQLFSNMVYGNFHFVLGGMKKRNQVRLTPHSPITPEKVIAMLESLPIEIVSQSGIRCFHDYVKQKEVIEEKYDELFALELEYGTKEPYMWLGKYFHVIVRKI